jgi:protein-tyrosine-phosphatase
MMRDQLVAHSKLNWIVLSAGISDKNKGKLTAKKMRDILLDMGYENNSVRSQPVTQELVDQADVIFVMDGANERKLVEKFGEQILSKIQYIGDWNTTSSRTIPDPHFHSGSEMHRKVAYLLEGSIHNLIGYHEAIYNFEEPLKGN